jgi:nucleotide-binding universal stress UspA family protein
MKRVLLPVDGSECSLRAVALVIAKRLLYAAPEELEIHLANVQPPLSHDISRFVSHEQIAGFHQEESKKAMRTACELLDAAGTKYTCHLLVGPVGEEIANLADSLQCDQIVMGTHGRSAFQEFLLGSITMKIVHLAKIPVLLVK